MPPALPGDTERRHSTEIEHAPPQYVYIVLAMVANWRFGSESGFELDWIHCNVFCDIKTQNCTKPALFWLVPHFRKLRTFAPMLYLSCACITIWYICKSCSCSCTFISGSPIYDLITIRWVAVKWRRKLSIFRTTQWIGIESPIGERDVKGYLKLHLVPM